MTSKLQEPCGSGVGEVTDQRPFSGPLKSDSLRAGPFSGPLYSSCPASLAPGDGHLACFRCLSAGHGLPCLPPPLRHLPRAGRFLFTDGEKKRCLKRGSSSGTFSFHRRWLSPRPSTFLKPEFRT